MAKKIREMDGKLEQEVLMVSEVMWQQSVMGQGIMTQLKEKWRNCVKRFFAPMP